MIPGETRRNLVIRLTLGRTSWRCAPGRYTKTAGGRPIRERTGKLGRNLESNDLLNKKKGIIYIYTNIYVCIYRYIYIEVITHNIAYSNIDDIECSSKNGALCYSLDELKPLSRSSQAFELKQNLPNYLPNLQ